MSKQKFDLTSIPVKIRHRLFCIIRELVRDNEKIDTFGYSSWYRYARNLKSGDFFLRMTYKKRIAKDGEEGKPKFLGLVISGNFRDIENSVKIIKIIRRSQKWRMKETTEKYFSGFAGYNYQKTNSPRRRISADTKEILKKRMDNIHWNRKEHFAKCPACDTSFECDNRRDGAITCINCEREFTLEEDITLVHIEKI